MAGRRGRAPRRGGNPEALRRYWDAGGPGGTKIRWGTGGDWARCVRQVSKYLGPKAKGFCQLRHVASTGMTTSAHAKALRGGRRR